MSDELKTDSVETFLCTVGGGVHDFRPFTRDEAGGRWQRTYWRCVWCHGVSCGNYGSHDPCWKVYHHVGPHRSRSGQAWPLGGTRPDGWAS